MLHWQSQWFLERHIMKIGYHGCNVSEGKVKFNDPRMKLLVDKCQPKKVSPFYVEFIRDEFTQCEAMVIGRQSILDLLIMDIEKVEARMERATEDAEKELLKKCQEALESEIPLCDLEISGGEKEMVSSMGVLSAKPVVVLENDEETDRVIERCLEKAGVVFFYTVGPKEVHAWPVARNADFVTCAGKIHTDLARGFIKGDIAHFNDYMSCHNWNDCRKKGIIKVVDRDYTIQSGDVIEIRFAV
jgi:ribosome-binding ATPase YchF (GTP1/OBG family)